MSNDMLKQPKLYLEQIKKIENSSDKIDEVIKYLEYQLGFLQKIYDLIESNVEFHKGFTESFQDIVNFQKEVSKRISNIERKL